MCNPKRKMVDIHQVKLLNYFSCKILSLGSLTQIPFALRTKINWKLNYFQVGVSRIFRYCSVM